MDQLLTAEEAARLLGTWETSGERFPRRLIAERRIAFVKVGHHVRIPAHAIADYIVANTVNPDVSPCAGIPRVDKGRALLRRLESAGSLGRCVSSHRAVIRPATLI